MKTILCCALLCSTIIGLNAQIVLNLGTDDLLLGAGSSGFLSVDQPVIQSTMIETTSYVDENGVRHTKTVEYKSNPDSGKPNVVTTETIQNASSISSSNLEAGFSDMLAFSNAIFKQMEQMLTFDSALNTGTIMVGSPRFRGFNQLQPAASSVVIQMTPDNNKNQAASTDETTNNASDAHNPDLTKPVMITESAENVSALNAFDGDNADLPLALRNTSLQQTEVKTAQKASPAAADKSFGRLIIIVSIGLFFAAIIIYYTRNSLLKSKLHKTHSMRAQLADFRKRED